MLTERPLQQKKNSEVVDAISFETATKYGVVPLRVDESGLYVEGVPNNLAQLESEVGLRVHATKPADAKRESMHARLREIFSLGADHRALARIKPNVAVVADALPLRLEGELEPVLVVAMADPSDKEKLALVQASARMQIKTVPASRSAVRAAIRLAYQLDEAIALRAQQRRRAPARQKIEDLAFECFDEGGQNLFIEGTPEGGQVRFGIDGVKYQRYVYDKAEYELLVTAVFNQGIGKGAEAEIGEGKLELAGHRKTIYARIVSYIADFTGREAVLRLHDTDTQPMTFAEAGLTGGPWKQLETALKQHKTGIYLFVGPGDSGKTMSAVALFRRQKLSEMKVIGIGDPPEFYVRDLSQIALHEKRPYSKIVSGILRAAADGMLPGEVRSMEDMVRVIDAGETGGLVAITTHADDPIVAINRLAKNIDRGTIAGVVRAVVGQRLVRRLCINCRVPSTKLLPDLRSQKFEVKKNPDGSVGCSACRYIGYSGRIGVFEVLRVNRAVAYAIERGVGPTQLEQLARKYGYRSLREDAFDKCVEGVTDIDEIERMLSIEADDSDPEDLSA